MVQVNPIRCPKCNQIVVSDERNLTNLVLYNDIKCSSCGTVVVYSNQTIM
jgi:endogenous inhibitor of DNA gyrase (YacG/DUF329 family)